MEKGPHGKQDGGTQSKMADGDKGVRFTSSTGGECLTSWLRGEKRWEGSRVKGWQVIRAEWSIMGGASVSDREQRFMKTGSKEEKKREIDSRWLRVKEWRERKNREDQPWEAVASSNISKSNKPVVIGCGSVEFCSSVKSTREGGLD